MINFEQSLIASVPMPILRIEKGQILTFTGKVRRNYMDDGKIFENFVFVDENTNNRVFTLTSDFCKMSGSIRGLMESFEYMKDFMEFLYNNKKRLEVADVIRENGRVVKYVVNVLK